MELVVVVRTFACASNLGGGIIIVQAYDYLRETRNKRLFEYLRSVDVVEYHLARSKLSLCRKQENYISPEVAIRPLSKGASFEVCLTINLRSAIKAQHALCVSLLDFSDVCNNAKLNVALRPVVCKIGDAFAEQLHGHHIVHGCDHVLFIVCHPHVYGGPTSNIGLVPLLVFIFAG